MLPVINFAAITIITAIVVFQYIAYSRTSNDLNARIDETNTQNIANLDNLKKESKQSLAKTEEQVKKDLSTAAASTKVALGTTQKQLTDNITSLQQETRLGLNTTEKKLTSTMDNYFKTMSDSITSLQNETRLGLETTEKKLNSTISDNVTSLQKETRIGLETTEKKLNSTMDKYNKSMSDKLTSLQQDTRLGLDTTDQKLTSSLDNYNKSMSDKLTSLQQETGLRLDNADNQIKSTNSTIDNYFKTMSEGVSTKSLKTNTADVQGALNVNGVLRLGNDIAHPDNTDGAIYRADGQLQIAADDFVRLRHTTSKETGIQFDTRQGNGDIRGPNGQLKLSRQGIMFGGPNNGRDENSAQISAGMHVPNSLNIIGMSSGKGAGDRRVDMWAEGGFNLYAPHVNLNANATVQSAGRIHVNGGEELYVLNKKGVIVGKEWGGNGNLQVQGKTFHGSDVVMQDKPIVLRGDGDYNHVLQVSGAVDGPRLSGCSGGQLGTQCGGAKTMLSWDREKVNVNGQLCIDGVCITKDHLNKIRAIP